MNTHSLLDVHANTTSNIRVGTTITSPNIKSMIQAVATILHSQLLEDQSMRKEIPTESDLYFFSEEKYIKEKPEAFDEQRLALLRQTPKVENIYEFIKALYDCAQFSPECCIICLVYINRLIAFTGLPLHPTNWRPLILCALLVAQKVWDDRYLSNADFAFIYPFFVTEEINKLEQKFLELIQYNVTVKSGLYAKYYFELRALFKDNEAEFPLTPLDNQQAMELELRSGELQKQEKSKAERLSLTQQAGTQKKANFVLN
eukprot:CAMPEP_0115030686 /NCGR_PEP_ID=MMETSP0216-20121206/37988_1 /TAXON_ID=223996 /ORGANISM="Protocruzia adherens, Strain Boccale" /LENGTH=258 /DNA_ID=CAMNT_0002407997 /DNA_START=87 /DNA_END=863 /DNA_ORIENTATION=-